MFGDVLDIDAVHILLGRPWMYDLDVTSLGRSNTYEFKFNEKRIMLNPATPKSSVGITRREQSPKRMTRHPVT